MHQGAFNHVMTSAVVTLFVQQVQLVLIGLEEAEKAFLVTGAETRVDHILRGVVPQSQHHPTAIAVRIHVPQIYLVVLFIAVDNIRTGTGAATIDAAHAALFKHVRLVTLSISTPCIGILLARVRIAKREYLRCIPVEWSGEFDLHDQKLMHSWCRHMINWYDVSPQGRGTGRSLTNHALIYDLSVLSLATYVSAADPSLAFVADATRTRLHYRLSQPAPLGHFTLNGQPFYDTGKPSALHDATTTIKCWLHLATVVEAIRANEQPAGAIESLWWTRHVDSSPQSQPQTAEALSQLSKPVLLKAVQWLLRYLPAESTAYFQYTTLRSSPTPETVDGGTRSIFNPEGVNGTLEVDAYYSFPYQQSTPFAYDRFLEIIHAACKIYGVEAVFPQTNSSSSGSGNNEVFAKRINAALSNDLYYNVHVASFTPYSSVDPSSGSRIWGELGIAARKTYK
jgi:hypothetical protein